MKICTHFALIIGSMFITLIFTNTQALAIVRGGSGGGGASISGDHSIGFGIGLLSANQSDINSAIDRANVGTGGPISTKNLGSAYEFYGQYVFRFSRTSYSLVFRPSYIMQNSTGSGTDGSYDYKLSGITFIPMFRVYPLESPFIKFYMQIGVGWGKLTADITTGSGNNVNFDGSAFGGQTGIGVDFCFTESHCLTIEGNIRYLPIERNVANSASGTVVGIDNPVTKSSEVEYNGKDLPTTLSGIQGILAYTYNF